MTSFCPHPYAITCWSNNETPGFHLLTNIQKQVQLNQVSFHKSNAYYWHPWRTWLIRWNDNNLREKQGAGNWQRGNTQKNKAKYTNHKISALFNNPQYTCRMLEKLQHHKSEAGDVLSRLLLFNSLFCESEVPII